MPAQLLQRRWNNLLAWLEGHGFQAQNLPVECREVTYGGVTDSHSSNIVDTKWHTAGNGLFARNAQAVSTAPSNPTADELHK